MHIDKLGPLLEDDRLNARACCCSSCLQEKARAVQQTYSEKELAEFLFLSQLISCGFRQDNVKNKSASDMAEYIKKFKTAQLSAYLDASCCNTARSYPETLCHIGQHILCWRCTSTWPMISRIGYSPRQVLASVRFMEVNWKFRATEGLQADAEA